MENSAKAKYDKILQVIYKPALVILAIQKKCKNNVNSAKKCQNVFNLAISGNCTMATGPTGEEVELASKRSAN